MSTDADHNPIPTAVKELLALFDGPLASVTFPDVDGPALREQVASVEAAVHDVEAAAAAWAEAKRAVDSRLEVLLQKAQRALAYARIYAEDKPELDATLASLVVPRWGDPRGNNKAPSGQDVAPARKRGRPRKSDVAPTPPPPEVAPAVTLLPEATPLPSAVEVTEVAEVAPDSEDAASISRNVASAPPAAAARVA